MRRPHTSVVSSAPDHKKIRLLYPLLLLRGTRSARQRGIIHGGGGRRVAEASVGAGAGAHRAAVVRRRRRAVLRPQGGAAEAAGEARAGGGGPGEELVGAADAAAAPRAAASQGRGRRQPALRHLHPHRQCPWLSPSLNLFLLPSSHLVSCCEFNGT